MCVITMFFDLCPYLSILPMLTLVPYPQWVKYWKQLKRNIIKANERQ